jgi:tetratricopeptide (TPR) repeat protein
VSRTSARLVGWLNLADGFNEYYSNLTTAARDKFRRAQAVTEFAGARTLSALASAWLAHLDYMSLQVDALVGNLEKSFSASSSDDHHVRSRASLVVAEALHYARRFDLARLWYDRARDHATADGDQPTLSAIMFNMAWLRMADARQSVLCEEPVTETLGLVRTGGRSASNYELLIGSITFRELDPLLLAEISSLAGEPSDALDLYAEHLAGLRLKGADRWKCVFSADRSWCFAQLGKHDDARKAASLAEGLLSAEVQVDDRASTYSWLARTYEALGDQTKAGSMRIAAEEAWASTRALQQRIVARLSDASLE